MNIHASIIDQRLSGVIQNIQETAKTSFAITDDGRIKALAFVYLCVKTMLDLDHDEVIDSLVEGGGDFGVDAIVHSEEIDGEFQVTVFQCKYKSNLEGNSNFPESGIDALVKAINYIFNPYILISENAVNRRLLLKIEEIRSMIRDGFIPKVHVVACNNGLKWNAAGQEGIDRANFGDQVNWEHVNHDSLVKILQRSKPVDAILRFSGKAIIEDMNYSRVCVGRVPVSEISNLMKIYGEQLLERNIRRYLGLHGNRVNEGIRNTLNSTTPSNFYFFNNGLTLVCSDFSYNALQQNDYQISIENLQIVNGAQTCMTILKTIEEMSQKETNLPEDASVLVRLYKLPKNNEDIVTQITHATNSQNPVDLKDLRSNHEKQTQLEQAIQDLGHTYRRKRSDTMISRSTEITSGVAAEAILAVWREAPHQAKFLMREHFGKLYETIFTKDLNAAQTIVAVLLYRIAQKHRRNPSQDDPHFIRYASCFIAMQMGRRLLKNVGIDALKKLNHRNFKSAENFITSSGEELFKQSTEDIKKALNNFYKEEPSLQQLSATFRRGDLIEQLKSDIA